MNPRERSLSAIVDMMRHGTLSFEAMLHCLCATLREPVLVEGDSPMQQWRWLLGRLNVVIRLAETGLLTEYCNDHPLAVKRMKVWTLAFREHQHLKYVLIHMSDFSHLLFLQCASTVTSCFGAIGRLR